MPHPRDRPHLRYHPHLIARIDYTLHSYKHSQLAAACILCHRKASQTTPLWPSVLTHITGYRLIDVRDIATKVWRCWHRDEKAVLGANVNFGNLSPGAELTAAAVEFGEEEDEEKRPLNVYELYMHI